MGTTSVGNVTRLSSDPLAQICLLYWMLPPNSRVCSNYYFNFVLAERHYEASTSFGGYSDLQTSGSGLLSTHEEHIGFPQTVLCMALILLLAGPILRFLRSSVPPGMRDLHRRESLQRAKPAYPNKHCLVLMPGMPHWLQDQSEELNRSSRLT